MKAAVYRHYGGAEQVELVELEKPAPGPGELLVKVRASSVNALEWHMVTGLPVLLRLSEGLRAPKSGRVGTDFAGTVEAVGDGVAEFKPGDDVFGGKTGAFAEYLCLGAERAVVHKPASISFEDAAALPVAGATALQAVRDHAGVQASWKVLVNGASGGVGTFAVQVAKPR